MLNSAFSGPARRQSGIALIESLVAIVVLAFGVLGLLGLQLRTISNNQSANYIATASRLADGLFERVKSNPNADPTLNPSFDPNNPLNVAQWAWLANYAVNWGATVAIATNCDTNFCTAAQKTTWDINQWKQTLAQTLPNGEGRILVSPDNPRQLIVIVGWRANEQGASPLVVNIPGVAAPAQCGTTHACYFAYGQP